MSYRMQGPGLIESQSGSALAGERPQGGPSHKTKTCGRGVENKAALEVRLKAVERQSLVPETGGLGFGSGRAVQVVLTRTLCCVMVQYST